MKQEDWDLIIECIRDELCVPFLGAGVSLGYNGPGLPTARQLAERLATACGYPNPDKGDLYRVAQFYELVMDRRSLQSRIIKELRVIGAQPGQVHRTIAQMPFRHVLTTNFDNLMERAFEDAGKNPKTLIYEVRGDRQELPIATCDCPLVYKLHGSLDRGDRKMIVTEDDVIEFICSLMLGEPPLPSSIKRLFEDHSILFIGYGLKDWTIRVMLRALRGGKRLNAQGITSFAIQRRPDDAGLATEWDRSVLYWQKSESLRCFDLDAVTFADELLRRWKKPA